MTHEEVQAMVFQSVARFFQTNIDVRRETTAANVRGWDSVTNMPFILDLEERLDIELPLSALGSLANVGALADLCHEVMAGG